MVLRPPNFSSGGAKLRPPKPKMFPLGPPPGLVFGIFEPLFAEVEVLAAFSLFEPPKPNIFPLGPPPRLVLGFFEPPIPEGPGIFSFFGTLGNAD